MIIYKSTTHDFDLDVRYNKITDKLEEEFIKVIGRKPSDSERRSFTNSLSKMDDILVNENLIKKDCGVLIEYQLPSSSMRLDFMITGKDKFMNKNAVIVELKQWENVMPSETKRQVYTYTGHAMREVNHPAVQVEGYKMYLENYQMAFHMDERDSINLYACSYLHNYKRKQNDAIFDDKFKPVMEKTPVFTKDDTRKIGSFIRSNVEKGDGLELIEQIEKSTYKPSKKLIMYVNNIIDSKNEFILVDDQLVVFDRVMHIVNNQKLDGTDGKHVVLVKGGPGTGKSVVGLNLLGKILKEDKECTYLAANAAFKNGMASRIDKKRAKALFKHPYFYNKDLTINNETFQIAIVDEAHRISQTPPPMQKKLDKSLIEGIIEKTHLSVFFTDDNQRIRPKDIGSYSHVKNVARKLGCELYEYELAAQFRCAGSEGYINWIDDVLKIRETANASGWENLDDMEFRIVDDPNIMKDKILMHQSMGSSARIVAGYAWPWSKDLNDDGSLKCDVKIEKNGKTVFEMPWNPQPKYNQKRAKGIPKDTVNWATEKDGVNQIGCIHTVQGLEFDYIGVIIGEEFYYDSKNDCFVADVSKCYDKKIGKNAKKEFLQLAKNTYKTLLTRGVKGVYVYCVNEDTQNYLKTRLKVVKKFEDTRFYHKKKVSICKIFNIEDIAAESFKEGYVDDVLIKLDRYQISKGEFGYNFCDFYDERMITEKLFSSYNIGKHETDDKLISYFEDKPQIRYYTIINCECFVDVEFTKFKAKAIVKRIVNEKYVYSFVF